MIIETTDNKLYAVIGMGTAAAWEAVPVRRAKIRGTYERRPNDQAPRLIRKAGAKVVSQFRLRDTQPVVLDSADATQQAQAQAHTSPGAALVPAGGRAEAATGRHRGAGTPLDGQLGQQDPV